MERKPKQSIDGLVPRGQLGGKARRVYGGAPVLMPREPVAGQKLAEAELDSLALKKDLQDSLNNLGVDRANDFTDLERSPQETGRTRRMDKFQRKLDQKNKKRAKKGREALTGRQFRVRRWLKRILIVILLAVLGYAGYFVYNAIRATGNIFDGNIFGFLEEQELMRDEKGRTNILVFGTEPEDHDGSNLTDSIIVASLNQDDGSVYMVSLPRDLYVKHVYADGVTTTRGKVNEVYYYGRLQNQQKNGMKEDEKRDDKAGAAELGKVATEVTGLEIQYYMHLSWDSVRKVTDALGGLDVKIESDDPRGLYDPATGVDYAQGEIAYLDGDAALALVRSRGAFGGWGFSSSNFARERNQQAILRGMQEKAAANGTLANPQTVVDLMNALGDTISTDFQTSEVRTLAKVAKNMKPEAIVSIPLMDVANGINYVVTDMIDEISYVVAAAGQNDFAEIREYIRMMIFGEGWERERAVIDVLNGSGVVGFGAAKAKELEQDGFRLGVIGNAPTTDYPEVTIYRVNGNAPATAKKLTEKHGVEVKDIAEANGLITASATADFVIVFGQ
jgi:LCP family protein required for cell wall assembly